MTLVACIVLVEVDEPDHLADAQVSPDNAMCIKQAVEDELTDTMLLVALMTPGDCRAMLDAHLEAMKGTSRRVIPLRPPTQYIH